MTTYPAALRRRVKALRLTFVFGLGVEIAGVMALVQLLVERAIGTVNYPSALHSRAIAHVLRPAQYVNVAAGIEEFRGV